MKIQVTQEHIDTGVAAACYNCPLALAFMAAGFVRPFVDNWTVRVDAPEGRFNHHTLPPEATRFIRHFDEKETGAPFEFDMAV